MKPPLVELSAEQSAKLAERTARFNAASDAEKRVLIARDAIKLQSGDDYQ
jgi:hypothetical protein